jgi:hypothetical protein
VAHGPASPTEPTWSVAKFEHDNRTCTVCDRRRSKVAGTYCDAVSGLGFDPGARCVGTVSPCRISEPSGPRRLGINQTVTHSVSSIAGPTPTANRTINRIAPAGTPATEKRPLVPSSAANGST